jgi:predicted GIY-YIG superfamily endonuclease
MVTLNLLLNTSRRHVMDHGLKSALLAECKPCMETGVYVLWDRGETAYVGSSRNGALRIGEHTRDRDPKYCNHRGIDFDSWTFVPCQESEMLELERSYIELLEPFHNMS